MLGIKISKFWGVFLFGVLLASLFSACGDTAATPTSGAAATTAAASGAATTAAASGGANSAPAADEAAIYEAAKKEGKFTWYTGFYAQDVVVEVLAAFSAKYPGITTDFVRNPSQTVYQKLTQEMQAGIKNADVFSTTDFGHAIELKETQKLLAYNPSGKDSIFPAYKTLDPDNFYHIGSIGVVALVYNTTKIKPAEMPTTWQGLLDDKFKDKISTGSAAASGQVGNWALSMQQKYGWDNYFPKFNKLNPKLGRSINDTVLDIVSGERALAIGPVGVTLANKAKGNPVDVVYPTDGTIVVVQPSAILKDAPHPNAAKLFMNFENSKEYANVLAKNFEAPIRADVTLSGGKSLTEIPTYSPKPEEVRKDLPDIITKWRGIFGA